MTRNIEKSDVVVTLDISGADETLTSIIFHTDKQHETIIVRLDSVSNSDKFIFGYDCGGESAYSLGAIFGADTIKIEDYAENGYSKEISLQGKKFIEDAS